MSDGPPLGLEPVVSGVRLAFALMLFLPALLVVVPPGLNAFWKLSIVVKEGGFFLALPCLALAILTFVAASPGWPARASALLFLGAALLYAYPLARAVGTAHRLDAEFARGFGRLPAAGDAVLRRSAPLVWKDFVTGIMPGETPQEVKPVTEFYADSLRLDFYPPVGNSTVPGTRAPCVVVIHGGAWDSGDRTQLPELNPWLARAGFAVASIDYRLAPEHPYPAPIEDVARALAFLKKDPRIDPDRFILLGRSAGGQIALQAAYTLKDPSVRGVIAFYAPADMVFGYSLPGNPLILDSRKVMDAYLGGSCAADPELCRASSPLAAADAHSPPTLLLHGAPDVLVSYQHTVHLEDRLAALGVPHFSVKLPWATHGYDFVFRGPGSQISLYFIERFLARTVERAVAPQ